MNVRKDHVLSVSLVYGIAALALILVFEVVILAFDFGKWMSSGRQPLQLEAALSTNVRSLGDLEVFEEIADRPLFVWNRRPIPVKNDPGVIQPDTGSIDSRWELSAVITSGAKVYAYFNEVNGSLSLRLEEGMFLEEWQVEAISGESVTLAASDADEQGEGQDERKVFRLKEISEASKKAKSKSRGNKTNSETLSRRAAKKAPKSLTGNNVEGAVKSK